MSNLDSTILRLLNEQIAHELYNSNFYRKIGSYLKNIGLDNLGSHFYDDQVSEEQGHAKLVTDFIVSRNEKVDSLTIPEVTISLRDIIQIAELYLKQEKDTTAKLSTIASQALSNADFITFGFMQDMIDKQRIEEEEAFTFLDKARMTQNDYKVVLVWDASYK